MYTEEKLPILLKKLFSVQFIVTPNNFEKSIKLQQPFLLLKSIFCLVYRDPEQFREVDQAEATDPVKNLYIFCSVYRDPEQFREVDQAAVADPVGHLPAQK